MSFGAASLAAPRHQDSFIGSRTHEVARVRSLFRLSSMLVPLVTGISACSDATGTWFAAPTAIHLRSDSGDVIGSGRSYDYTQANAFIQAGLSGVPVTLTVTVQGAETWTGFFSMPNGVDRLKRGT